MGPAKEQPLDRSGAAAGTTSAPALAAPRHAGEARWWEAAGGGIGRRLLVLMVTFSLLVTVLLSALQLYLDYRRDLGAIEARLTEIGTSYSDSLAASLWNVDQPQLDLQLQGIRRLPEIQWVELRETGALREPLLLSAGSRGGVRLLTRDYPLVFQHRGERRPVGTLHVEATLDPLFDRLAETAKANLLTQAVQTFLVALFLLYVVHRMVTRHLAEISRFVSGFDLQRVARPLRLDRAPPSPPDELDRVVESFNNMSVYLHRAYADLEQANEELESGLALRRSYEEKLERQAHYDTLTGLANRVLLLDRLHFALRRAQRTGLPGALLCIDLDRFKNINDSLGHAAGDELLKEAAHRLSRCVRDADTLARMGGDEFAVIAAEVESEEGPSRLAMRILEELAAPFLLEGHAHHVTASIGITLFPADGGDTHRLLRNGELAMYKAKDSGRNRHQCFEEQFNQALTEQMAMEERLRSAVANGELVLHYQPIVELKSRRVVGHEALLRWRTAEGGLCMPDRFIPRAEEMGLITEFGRWALESACGSLPADGRRVAVNVSPRQLQEPGFADFVSDLLRRHGLTPALLELEITERVVMDDSPDTEANLRLLCALGIRLSIDDFGIGYSSLAYLQKYPFDTLKIDRSFVTAALQQESAARLVETIIAMGHALGQEVIAEGIETEEQFAFLEAAGCELGQGYYFGRPAPRD